MAALWEGMDRLRATLLALLDHRQEGYLGDETHGNHRYLAPLFFEVVWDMGGPWP